MSSGAASSLAGASAETASSARSSSRTQWIGRSRAAIPESLAFLGADENVMLKLTLPEVDDFYGELVGHPRVARVLALSGGYSREEATSGLARNHGVIASFSRALTEGLSVDQTPDEFDSVLARAISTIFEASAS